MIAKNTPLSAYSGTDDYAFICYSHADQEVPGEIRHLQDLAINVWYDNNILAGSEWTDTLARQIQQCSRFIYFLTKNSANSEHCRRELNFAQSENKEIIVIQLEDVDLPPGLRLSINNRQIIFRNQLNKEDYEIKLKEVFDASFQSFLGINPYRESNESNAGETRAVLNYRSARTITVTLIAFVIVGLISWQQFSQQNENEFPADVAESSIDPLTVAVLPFNSIGDDPENGSFAQGLHGDLLTQLSKVGSFNVISRSSMSQYKDTNKGMREIANELGAGSILEGAVQRSGDLIRINVQLIDALIDENVWAETFDRNLSVENIFAIQSSIVESIAQSLDTALSESELNSVNDVPTENLAAYNFYLKGMEYWAAWENGLGNEYIDLAIEQGTNAINEDPAFDLAIARTSQFYAVKYWFTERNNQQVKSQVLDLALQALAINPDSYEAHYALGLYYAWGEADMTSALREFALAEPGLKSEFQLYALIGVAHGAQGNMDLAIQNKAKALELNPRSPREHAELAIMYERVRDYAMADELYDKARVILPTFPLAVGGTIMLSLYQGNVSQMRARTEELIDEIGIENVPGSISWMHHYYEGNFETVIDRIGDMSNENMGLWTLLARSYRLRDEEETAIQILNNAREVFEGGNFANAPNPNAVMATAEVYALLGEREPALELAERLKDLKSYPQFENERDTTAFHLGVALSVYAPLGEVNLLVDALDVYLSDNNPYSIEGIIVDPVLEPYINDPRFVALVEEHSNL